MKNFSRVLMITNVGFIFNTQYPIWHYEQVDHQLPLEDLRAYIATMRQGLKKGIK